MQVVKVDHQMFNFMLINKSFILPQKKKYFFMCDNIERKFFWIKNFKRAVDKFKK